MQIKMADDAPERTFFLRIVIFFVHCFTAIIATTLVTMALAAAVETLFGERTSQLIFGGPFFFAFFTLGLCSGFGINRLLNSKSAQWVWVLVLCWCLILVSDQIRTPGFQGVLHDIWTDYFGNSNCGGTECFYELLGTWPLFSSIGYSIGSLAARSLTSKKFAVPKGLE